MDMTAYFSRLGLGPSSDRSLAGLQAAHLQHIPFENLDVLEGRPIRLDLDSVFDKLVTRRRGGYCFEQNRLFTTVLQQLGFEVRARAARVRRGTRELRPLTHRFLEVPLHGRDLLVDVGFGGEGPMLPTPMDGEIVSGLAGLEHRVISEDQEWVLQSRHQGQDWVDLYAFERHDRLEVDFEQYNHWTQTHPSSLFVNSMLLAIHMKDGYRILFNGQLKTWENARLSMSHPESPLSLFGLI
jgi:N-hydroxyarylamine O-acetyltransferase